MTYIQYKGYTYNKDLLHEVRVRLAEGVDRELLIFELYGKEVNRIYNKNLSVDQLKEVEEYIRTAVEAASAF